MRVKRYTVDSLPEAVSLIRTDLGSDAVILESKEVLIGGFLGMFRKKKIEVVAALESESRKPVKQSSAQSSPQINEMVEQILQTAKRSAPKQAAPDLPEPISAETVSDLSESASSSTLARSEKEQFIVDEIRELRAYMSKLSMQSFDRQTLSEPLYALKERLQDQELNDLKIQELITLIQEKQREAGRLLNKEEVWEFAEQVIASWMELYPVRELSSQVNIVHFVGPTGVGKTTSIAKLAAEQSIKRGRKVGFITSDTYRIAAVDQLRTYANILNVPLEVVFSAKDLAKAYHQLENRDLILMDTAGRNFKSELHVSEVSSLLQTSVPSETLLVLSLTGKSKDMIVIGERFKQYGVNKVLFTKLDETTVYGAIFNVIVQLGFTPTYMASGQTVPDDIGRFDTAAYIKLLLGAWDDEGSS